MKIFISWSGEHAKLIARALHAWLGDIFDGASPWMSDLDIAGGQRGLNEIERSLVDAGFGVIVTTRDNHGAPWLNYEAGALGNQLETDTERRVVPVLVNVRLSEIKGPIGQFQNVKLDHDGIADLVKSIGQVLGQDPTQVARKFEVWWPELDKALSGIEPPTAPAELPPPSPAEQREETAEVLEEILSAVRYIRDATPPIALAPEVREVHHGPGVGVPPSVRRTVYGLAPDYGFTVLSIDVVRADDGARVVAIKFRQDGSSQEARQALLDTLAGRHPAYRFQLYFVSPDSES